MALSNYSELQTAIASWLHRTDLASTIPDFIRMAEVRINKTLATRGTEVETALTATTGSAYVDLPSDFNSPIALWLESFVPRRKLVFVSQENLDYYPVQVYPTYWTIKGSKIQFDRLAGGDYPLTFRYNQNIQLSGTSPTNYVLTNYPDIYLFGALIESTAFINDDARLALWQERFDTAMQNAQQSENNSKNGAILMTEPSAMAKRRQGFNIFQG